MRWQHFPLWRALPQPRTAREGYSHTCRCCTDSCNRGQNVVKRSSSRFPLLWMVKITSMSRLRMRITLGSKDQGHKSGVVNRSRLIWTVKNLDPGRSYMYSAYICNLAPLARPNNKQRTHKSAATQHASVDHSFEASSCSRSGSAGSNGRLNFVSKPYHAHVCQQLWPLVYSEAPPRHSSSKRFTYVATSSLDLTVCEYSEAAQYVAATTSISCLDILVS